MIDVSPDPVEFDFPIVSQGAREALEDEHARALEDYKTWKTDFLEWLHHEGKKPETGDGYAEATLRQTHYKTDQIFQLLWNHTEGYTVSLTEDQADEIMLKLGKYTDKSDSELLIFTKVFKRIFRYYNYEKGRQYDWEKPYSLSEPDVTQRDYFKQDEFTALFEASMNRGGVRSYQNCTPEERESIKSLLAQRFEKPKDSVKKSDFRRANSFKIPSLVGTALDCGLRPIEVGRAKVDWVNFHTGMLDIPKEESTKNTDNWECALSERTLRCLEKWVDERERYEKYADSEKLWLNKVGNAYNSNSLNRLLNKLLEETEIEPAGRDLTWYSIRHGVATLWVESEGVADARPQMRHKSKDTTLGYASTDGADRKHKANSKW